MRVTWGHIRAVRRMRQDLLSKSFKEVEGLVGHMWSSVVLQKHYPFRELASTLVLDALFEFHQRVTVHLSIYCCSHLISRGPLLSKKKLSIVFSAFWAEWTFLDEEAGMLPLHAHPFGSRVEVVTPSFITCHNLAMKFVAYLRRLVRPILAVLDCLTETSVTTLLKVCKNQDFYQSWFTQ